MSITIRDIAALLVMICFAVASVLYFLKIKHTHDAIDSVADARAIKVINLGRGPNGKNQFAITYKVLIDVPFEIVVTPTTTHVNMGDLVTIYYNSKDHSNYYIPTKWKIDDRMKKAITLVVIAVVCLCGCVIKILTRG